MTRKEFDLLPSDGKVQCPDCGRYGTAPDPGCYCRAEVGYHINKYHHYCGIPDPKVKSVQLYNKLKPCLRVISFGGNGSGRWYLITNNIMKFIGEGYITSKRHITKDGVTSVLVWEPNLPEEYGRPPFYDEFVEFYNLKEEGKIR